MDAHILDLAVYEVGNVLVRVLGWEPAQVADQLDDLLTILGPPLLMTQDWLRHAAYLAHVHSLTFKDASWAATAQSLNMTLVSMPIASKGLSVAVLLSGQPGQSRG